MLRKLIALALIGGGIAAAVKKAQQSGASSSSAEPFGASSGPAGGEQPAGAGETGAAAAAAPEPEPDDLADVRSGQTEATIQQPIPGAGGDEQAVIPDVSADDAVVREQEQAAAADAGSIGGDGNPSTADTDPSMRPVYEGSGDAPETFEATDEQGR
jgi:hypothetical protein